MSERWGDSRRDRDQLDKWLTREDEPRFLPRCVACGEECRRGSRWCSESCRRAEDGPDIDEIPDEEPD